MRSIDCRGPRHFGAAILAAFRRFQQGCRAPVTVNARLREGRVSGISSIWDPGIIANCRRLPSYGQTTDLLANVRLRKLRGEELVDLSSRLAATRSEQVGRVLRVEVRRQPAQRRTRFVIPEGVQVQ